MTSTIKNTSTTQTNLFAKIDEAMKEDTTLDYWISYGYVKALTKELAFNVGGHMLHTTFWENMAPAGKGGGGQPGGAIADAINKEFGSFDAFKKIFSAAAHKHRRLRLGCAGNAPLHRATDHSANRKTQRQRHTQLPDPDGTRRLGARLLR